MVAAGPGAIGLSIGELELFAAAGALADALDSFAEAAELPETAPLAPLVLPVVALADFPGITKSWPARNFRGSAMLLATANSRRDTP